MKIDRQWAMPSKHTFTIKPIKDLLLESISRPVIVDPFAGYHSPGTITNDLDPEAPTDSHLDAIEFLATLEDSIADTILYDPPYSITQATTMYGGRGKNLLGLSPSNMQYWKTVKDNLARILKPEGIAICCGWSSMGLGLSRHCVMTRVLLVPHGGSKNDTIVTVEEKL